MPVFDLDGREVHSEIKAATDWTGPASMALPIRPGLASLFGFQQNRADKPFLGSVVRVSHRARSAFAPSHAFRIDRSLKLGRRTYWEGGMRAVRSGRAQVA